MAEAQQGTPEDEEHASFARSKKNKELLIYKGFVYRRDKEAADKSTWRCSLPRRHHCSGRAWLFGNRDVTVVREHNHEADAREVHRVTFLTALKQAAQRQIGTPTQLMANAVASLEPGTSASLPPVRSLKRTVRRIRSKDVPATPRTLAQLRIPDRYKSSVSGGPFLQHDSGPKDGNQRFLIFGTESSLRAMSRSSVWLMDGTFSVASALIYQLYTFSYLNDGASYVALYCLLPSKTLTLYTRVLEAIKTLLVEELRLETALFDFESGFINAFRNTFPDVTTHGCTSHFSQAIWRHLQCVPTVQDRDTN